MQTISLSVRVGQLRVNFGFPEGSTGHLEEPDKVVLFAGTSRDLNNFHKVRGILGPDVRV